MQTRRFRPRRWAPGWRSPDGSVAPRERSRISTRERTSPAPRAEEGARVACKGPWGPEARGRAVPARPPRRVLLRRVHRQGVKGGTPKISGPRQTPPSLWAVAPCADGEDGGRGPQGWGARAQAGAPGAASLVVSLQEFKDGPQRLLSIKSSFREEKFRERQENTAEKGRDRPRGAFPTRSETASQPWGPASSWSWALCTPRGGAVALPGGLGSRGRGRGVFALPVGEGCNLLVSL